MCPAPEIAGPESVGGLYCDVVPNAMAGLSLALALTCLVQVHSDFYLQAAYLLHTVTLWESLRFSSGIPAVLGGTGEKVKC